MKECMPARGQVAQQWRLIARRYLISTRSSDGAAFSAIGTIPAKNSPGAQNYSFSDREPIGEKTYYRLILLIKTSFKEGNTA